MGTELWLAVIATAVGTLMMRILPLLWMQHHLLRRNNENAIESMPTWLNVLGPTMIAAMCGVSLVPTSFSAGSGLATISGVIATTLVWQRTRSLGWPVFAGVLIYGVVALLAGTVF